MKKVLFGVVVLVVLCLALPALVGPSVTAGSGATARKHFIKSIYYVRHTFANPSIVMEWYFNTETKDFRVHRGAFERYDAYTYYFGGGGQYIELYFYWK